MRIHFVCFHVGLRTPDPFLDMVAMMAASARRFHAEGKVVILTDDKTVIPAGVADAVINAPGVDAAEIMLDRAKVEYAYMRSPLFSAPTVFLDSDVLVNARLDGVFREPFDVALTWRKEIEGQPYNGGVKFVTPGEGAREFWRACILEQQQMEPKLRKWWGDQLAMHRVVGIPEDKVGARTMAVAAGAKVKLFPCETHNFSPDPDRPPPHRLANRLLVHFKGDRKSMMRDYAGRCLGLVTPLPEAA